MHDVFTEYWAYIVLTNSHFIIHRRKFTHCTSTTTLCFLNTNKSSLIFVYCLHASSFLNAYLALTYHMVIIFAPLYFLAVVRPIIIHTCRAKPFFCLKSYAFFTAANEKFKIIAIFLGFLEYKICKKFSLSVDLYSHNRSIMFLFFVCSLFHPKYWRRVRLITVT